ncbi:MAG: hypothetical protein KF718_24280 [Polyangiaceae bacterium]|nr:hypothetical protein [Polyangiaceae bacterium]
MGLLSSRWEADWDGVHITVHRNEVTKGFSVEADGRTLDEKSWSLIGVGELQGTLEKDGREVNVWVELPLAFRNPKCFVRVDGKEIAVKQVK